MIEAAYFTKTKYSKPQINQYQVTRQHLHWKLNNSLKCKLTLITAPAGYGKTTAVLKWLEKRVVPAAWLSIDSNDNNPMVFWRYICTALDDIAAGISSEAEYVFSSLELIKANLQINILIDRLAEVKTDFLLIIDDLHAINNPLILKGLTYLIDYLPPRMHLILISRTEPELELAKHQIKSQVLRFDIKDLRFRSDEISRFYKIRGIPIEDNVIPKIESYTEGWVAALVAIAMSVEDSTGNNHLLASIACCSHGIDQYLKDEVFDSWPLEKRVFVLKTSILDELCGSLCYAVTGDKNGEQILKEIGERNEFLIPLDEDKRMYRYHHLFKDFLYKLLVKSDPAGLSELHLKAADWYREQGIFPKAIEHYLNGMNYDEALILIQQQIIYLAKSIDYDTAFSWINRLPESYRAKSSHIAAVYAMYYAELNRFDLSRQWIGRIKELTPINKEDLSLQARISLISINLLLREGKMEQLLSMLAGSAANGYKNFIIPEYMDFNTADIYFYRCPINKLARLFGDNYNVFVDFIKNYRRTIIKNPGYAPLAAGEYYYETNRMEEALPYLLEALDEARSANCPGSLVSVMVDLARIKRARGDLPGAFAVLEECEELIRGINKIHWNYLVNAFRTRLYLDTGNTDMVDKWIDNCKLSIYSEINRIIEFELIVYARVLLARNRADDAQLLLTRLLSYTEVETRLHSRVEVLNLLAILAYGKGELSGAVGYMEKSLATGMKEGYIRSYIDEFEPMVGVLKQTVSHLRKKKDSGAELMAYAQGLIHQAQANLRELSPAGSEAALAGIQKLLTEKEIKVLELLYAAHTNEEICLKMGIGMRTVKTHTGNIYSKLGVKNRAQCIKLVREKGLLV